MLSQPKNVYESGPVEKIDTLIAYASRFGGSKRVALLIAKFFREKFSIKVDIINLKNKNDHFDLDHYRNVIFGSGIAGDEWTKAGKEFLNHNFSNTRLAIFVTSGNAGEAIKQNDHESYLKWQKQYILDVITPFGLQPFSIKAFGGQLPSIGKKLYNTLNEDHIKEWADELGHILK